MFIYRKMVFTEEDKVAIKFLRDSKRYGAKRLLAEFPAKQWSLGGCHGRVQTCRPMGACIACLVISVTGVCGRCWS